MPVHIPDLLVGQLHHRLGLATGVVAQGSACVQSTSGLHVELPLRILVGAFHLVEDYTLDLLLVVLGVDFVSPALLPEV